MISIDSCKILVEDVAIDNIDYSKLEYAPRYSSSRELVQDLHFIKQPTIGVKQLTYDSINKCAIIETSAKVLRDNYLTGICTNTAQELFDRVSSVGAIEFNSIKAIENSNFKSLDVCQNINWERTSSAAQFRNLDCAILSDRYTTKIYNTSKNKGLDINGNYASKKVRLIAYDKNIEVTKTSKFKNFLSTIDRPNLFLNSIQNTIRVESNIASLSEMRKRLNVTDTSMIEVLNSSASPNYDFLKQVYKLSSGRQIELFNEDVASWSELEKLVGRKTIIEKCNYDVSMIKSLIKKYSKSPRAFQHIMYGRGRRGGLLHLLSDMKAKKFGGKEQNIIELNDMFLTMLKVA